MSTGNDTNVRLTTSERNSIITNEARGIQHPLYLQVRKRRTPLVSNEVTSQATRRSQSSQHAQAPPQQHAQQTHTPEELKHDQPNYDSPQSGHTYSSVTNRELLERMLDVLQKNVHSNDEDKNSVENERITQDNQQFIDNIVKANEQAQRSQEQIQQPVVQPTRVVRRGRVLI